MNNQGSKTTGIRRVASDFMWWQTW